MAYVAKACATAGTPVQIDTGRATLAATVQATPFYANATARKALSGYLQT
jgi:glycine cleavage system aminomethyltransferase T